MKELACAFFGYVKDWTRDHTTGHLKYNNEPTVSKNMWMNTKELLDMQKRMKIKRGIAFVNAVVPGGQHIEIPDLERDEFSSFEEYSNNYNAYYNVRLPNDNFLRGECDCESFYNQYYCKHMLAVAVSVGLAELPPSIANRTPVVANRTAGRPKKSRSALYKD